ncbi:MAG: autoantigen p27 domain-containing protein [Archaeoglobaceae archaeon]
MEDKKISDISKLLIRGAKMLSYHCPECNVPLFQEGDTMFCPSCQKEAVTEQEGERRESKERAKTNTINSKSEVQQEDKKVVQDKGAERKTIKSGHTEFRDTDMETSLKNSLARLSNELENANDVKEIKEIVELMDQITSLAERIKKI